MISSRLLLATALTCSMAAPVLAGVGGSDNFDSNATSQFSDYGGKSGYGNTASSRGSSCQCNDSYSVGQLGQIDRIGPGGSHRVETYQNGRLVGSSSDPGPSWDETTGRYFREQSPQQPEAKPTPDRPESKPITRTDMLVSAEPVAEYQAPAPSEPLPGKLADQEPEQISEALNYMKRHVVDRIGPPTKSEKDLARAMGMTVGAVTGFLGGGIGKSDHVLSKRVTGVLLGAGMGGKTKASFMEGAARDLMTLNSKEMQNIESTIGKMSSQEQDRLTGAMRSAIREQRAVERKQSDRSHKANEGGKRK